MPKQPGVQGRSYQNHLGHAIDSIDRKNNGENFKRISKKEVEQRRLMVMRMRMRGLTYQQISQEMSISFLTIKKDLDAIREDNAKKIGRLERNYALGEAVSTYEEIRTRAWEEYNDPTTNATTRAKYLEIVRSAQNDQTKLLMDVGLISKAPAKHEHVVATDVISHWTPAAQDLIAMAVIKSKYLKPPIQKVLPAAEENIVNIENNDDIVKIEN